MEQVHTVLKTEIIAGKICTVRGKRVMLDRDLAELYHVSTRDLNKAVKRNCKRFPADFMFQLSDEEFESLMFHFGTSRWGGTRKVPNAFTEQGVAMLASVLRSERAIMVSVQIIRVFTKLREMLELNAAILQRIEEIQKKEVEQDQKIILIFEYLKQLEQQNQQKKIQKERKRIGFKRNEEMD